MKINKNIFKRFISDKFSFNDYLSVSFWFKNENQSSELMNCMKEEWTFTESTGDNEVQLAFILNRLHSHIKQENFKSKAPTFRNLYERFSRIAAILFFPALITIAILSYFVNHSTNYIESYTEIYAPLGTRAKFQLPDGTVGWLNSGSSIKFPVNFKERHVEISGEAWFDVTHKKSEEFRVITPYFDVKVLGTRFNVVAYDDEETAEVILEKGKVAILDKNEKIAMELISDQQLIYHKTTNKLIKKVTDSKSYTSWKDGLLIFKNVPMSEIARRLGRKYNMDIIIHGDALKTSVFRATFSDERIEEICKMISEVAPIEYKISKREIQSDNTFSKGKIEFWLKREKQ